MFQALQDASADGKPAAASTQATGAEKERRARGPPLACDDDFQRAQGGTFSDLRATATTSRDEDINAFLEQLEGRRLAAAREAAAAASAAMAVEEPTTERATAPQAAALRGELRAGMTPALRAQMQQQQQQGQEVVADANQPSVAPVAPAAQAATPRVPVTTYLTPQNLLARRLIFYDREKHLPANIQTFVNQVRQNLCIAFSFVLCGYSAGGELFRLSVCCLRSFISSFYNFPFCRNNCLLLCLSVFFCLLVLQSVACLQRLEYNQGRISGFDFARIGRQATYRIFDMMYENCVVNGSLSLCVYLSVIRGAAAQDAAGLGRAARAAHEAVPIRRRAAQDGRPALPRLAHHAECPAHCPAGPSERAVLCGLVGWPAGPQPLPILLA